MATFVNGGFAKKPRYRWFSALRAWVLTDPLLNRVSFPHVIYV
jgi:hypothetical protein